MERHLFAFGDGGDFLNRKEDAGFVVGPEKRDNCGVGGDGCFEFNQVEFSLIINGEPGNLIATGG